MIRLFHKELEAYLVAEGLFDEEITEDGKDIYINPGTRGHYHPSGRPAETSADIRRRAQCDIRELNTARTLRESQRFDF